MNNYDKTFFKITGLNRFDFLFRQKDAHVFIAVKRLSDSNERSLCFA